MPIVACESSGKGNVRFLDGKPRLVPERINVYQFLSNEKKLGALATLINTSRKVARSSSNADVSIIISTLNRRKELEQLLTSVLRQSVLPKEIIIVDDSDNSKTQDLANRMNGIFSSKRVALRYVPNTICKSLAAARNVGVNQAGGAMILFLDDDMILESDFVEELLKVYKIYPNAIGVSGNVWCSTSMQKENTLTKLMNSILRIFCLSHYERDKFTVLPSGQGAVPMPLTGIIRCQRLSGANMMYKRFIFDHFKFDEKLIGWSWLEDVDFSFRVNEKFPNSLYLTPFAKAIHQWSCASRLPSKFEKYMINLYESYFFCKNIGKRPLNVIIFIWSRIGKIVVGVLEFVVGKDRSLKTSNLLYTLSSYLYTLRFLKSIQKGELAFFNKVPNALA